MRAGEPARPAARATWSTWDLAIPRLVLRLAGRPGMEAADAHRGSCAREPGPAGGGRWPRPRPRRCCCAGLSTIPSASRSSGRRRSWPSRSPSSGSPRSCATRPTSPSGSARASGCRSWAATTCASCSTTAGDGALPRPPCWPRTPASRAGPSGGRRRAAGGASASASSTRCGSRARSTCCPSRATPPSTGASGDLSLFLAGVFPDHTASRAFRPIELQRLGRAAAVAGPAGEVLGEALETRGGVGLLDQLGARWYRLAAGTPRPRPAPRPACWRPSPSASSQARRALNLLADRHLFPSPREWFPAP